ncbi:pilus assembly protein PilM [bacterium]|nr:pilus assembly protein PilM [bacterium]
MATLKKCLGVDLGTSAVKVVELAVDRTGVKVVKAASMETNIDPSAPAEERRTAVAKTLRDLIRKNKISTKNAVFAIPGQKVFIRRFRLPETTEERLERIVTYEARQQIPFPLDKTDLQWQFFPVPEDKEVEVLLVAVRHDEVTDFMSLVGKTGLKPIFIAVSSFAIFNTQAFLTKPAAAILEILAPKKKAKPKKEKKPKKAKKKKGEAEAPEEEVVAEEPMDDDMSADEFVYEEVKGYVNIGAAAMDLAIAREGKKALLGFSRSVPTAGNEITRSVMEACQISSFHDAERIKRHQTRLMTFDFEFEEDPNINHDACSAATHSADRMISELRRSIDFYISQPDGMAVDSLVLSGGQALLPGMDTYIEEKLTLPTETLKEPPEDSALTWPDPSTPITSYVVAMGLALQGVGMSSLDVDFLPEDRKITRDFPYKSVAIMVVLLLGIIAMASRAGLNYTSQYQAEAQSLETLIKERSKQDTLANQVQAQHTEIAGLYKTFDKGVVDREYWLKFLAEVAEVKPPEVLLDRVSLSSLGQVTIVGLSETQRSAADFTEALRKKIQNPLQAPTLEAVQATRDARYEQPVYRFQISLQTSDKINILDVVPQGEVAE